MLQRLARQTKHEIQVEVEPCLPRPFCSLPRRSAVMPPPEQLQKRIIQTLNAKAESIGARTLKALELGEVGVAGVALQRDLRCRQDLERVPSGVEDARHLGRGHQARRPTAKEDAVDRFATALVQRQLAFD